MRGQKRVEDARERAYARASIGQKWFIEGLPDNVYRGKGLLWLAESDKRYIFHLVAKRFSLDEDGRQGQAGNK
jgi:G3E family GTPase